jgi:hypothetical protein
MNVFFEKVISRVMDLIDNKRVLIEARILIWHQWQLR